MLIWESAVGKLRGTLRVSYFQLSGASKKAFRGLALSSQGNIPFRSPSVIHELKVPRYLAPLQGFCEGGKPPYAGYATSVRSCWSAYLLRTLNVQSHLNVHSHLPIPIASQLQSIGFAVGRGLCWGLLA